MKKSTLALFLFFFIIGQLTAAPCGDVNSNGKTDIVDALLIAQYYVQLGPDNFNNELADVNGDDNISIVDALLVAQYYVGIISSLEGCRTDPSTSMEPKIIFAANCGGSAYTASDGTKYSADTGYVVGGSAFENGASVTGTSDGALYSTERYGSSSYSVNVPKGEYLIKLYFAENFHTQAGARIFNVKIEGTKVIKNLDIFAKVGKGKSYTTEHKAKVSDGKMNIEFVSVTENALINAIKVTALFFSGEPSAVFSLNKTHAKPGETIKVDASASSDSNGIITKYNVDYGDGFKTNGAVTSHSYSREGEYTIILRVTDNEGKSDSLKKTVVIAHRNTPASLCELGKEIAKRVSYNIQGRAPNSTYYAVACAWHGVLTYADLVKDNTLINKSKSVYGPYLNGSKKPKTNTVDDNIFGIWPFGLHRATGDSRYLSTALFLADDSFKTTKSGGLSRHTRFWADDLYMICSLQTQAYRATNDIKYMDRCGIQLEAYFNKLQQPSGLFHHTSGSPNFWGRANGWAASAMTEVLMVMPKTHPKYYLIMSKFKLMMDGLAKYQDSTGMWHQVINIPSSYRETSCTAMFLFAIATGVRLGWLPEVKYLAIVEKGFSALSKYVDSNGATSDICIGTGHSSGVDY